LPSEKVPQESAVALNKGADKPYPNRARRWREVSAEMRRRGTGLFDQQMWCWGQDIRHSGGNALLSYGFTRYRPSETEGESRAASSYLLLENSGEIKVALWGFGVLYRDTQAADGGLFLGRYDFAPRLVAGEAMELRRVQGWSARAKPRLAAPATPDDWAKVRGLFPSMLNWIIGYEQWVIGQLGSEYRRQCIASWLRPVLSPEAALDEWCWLKEQAARLGLAS
jgi:hypothetical protein